MRLFAILLSIVATLAGCATPTTDETGGTPAPTEVPTTATVEPRQPNLVHSAQQGDANFFDPETLRVATGSTVTWDIVGEGHHTVDFLVPIDAAGETPKSGDLGPGQTFEVTFTEPGTYEYYCKYHSNKQTGMMGTIIVE